jgi:hypothetical protein
MMMAQYGLDGRRIINPNNNYKNDHSSKIGNTKQNLQTPASMTL